MTRLTALVIDDDPADAAFVSRLLGRADPPIDVRTAETLAEGLELIYRKRPDALLLDLHLPESAGEDTFRAVHEQYPDLPTVVLTGLDDRGTQRRLIAAGAQDYLVKGGFDEVRLATTIRHAVERQRLVVQQAYASRRLERSEQLFRLLTETAHDVIYRCDLDGRFEYVSPASIPVLGYRPEQLCTDPSRFWERAAYRDEALAWPGPDGCDTRTVGGAWSHPDGRELWLEDVRSGIVEDGRLVAVQGVIRDVTDARRRQRALQAALDREQAATEHLRTLNDMKTSFLSATSHELRTPLTSIIGFATTLANHDGRLSTERRLALLERLVHNAERLTGLVDDLLDVDRLARGVATVDARRTDVNALVVRTIEHLGSSAARVAVQPGPAVWADVDPAKFERIVEGLVSNALRHTGATDRVWVSLDRHDHGVLLLVDDEGPGVPVELRETIFEPFQQGPAAAAAASPGTGVGLALVTQLAASHHGRAWVESSPWGGARFAVWLPQPLGGDRRASDIDGVAGQRTVIEREAASGLLQATSRTEVWEIVARTIDLLGGSLVPADEADDDAIPMDVSLGEGRPMLVVPTSPEARARLERVLPRLVEDVRATKHRPASVAADDLRPLTRVATTREWLPSIQTGEPALVLTLDPVQHPGPLLGDTVPRQVARFAALLHDHLRPGGRTYRVASRTFVVVLAHEDEQGACEALDRLRSAWTERHGAGAARIMTGVTTEGPAATLELVEAATADRRADQLTSAAASSLGASTTGVRDRPTVGSTEL